MVKYSRCIYIYLDFYSVDIMWYKEFLNNGEYLKIKLDDEEED